MFLQLITLFSILSVAFSGVALTQSSKSVSAGLKDNTVDGLEGVGLKVAFPFKFEDYTVGFRHAFGASLAKGPQALFARKTFDAPQDSSVTVGAEYETDSNVFSVAAKWVRNGLSVLVDGDSQDKLKSVEVASVDDFKGNKVASSVNYNLLSKNIGVKLNVTKDDTTVRVSYDTDSKNPVIAVAHKLDDSNTITPSVGIKDQSIKLGWLRKFEGGSIDAVLTPGEKLDLDWADESTGGIWRTKASIPTTDLDFKGTKISVSRDWKY